MLTIVLKNGKAMQYRIGPDDGRHTVEELNANMNRRQGGRDPVNYSWFLSTESGVFCVVLDDIALVSYDMR